MCAYRKKGFILITTILYSLLIFCIIGASFSIILNSLEDIKIERSDFSNINYFNDIDKIITDLNLNQEKIYQVVDTKKEKDINGSLKLSFSEVENCFYINSYSKEICKMKLSYINEKEKYILYPYFEK